MVEFLWRNAGEIAYVAEWLVRAVMVVVVPQRRTPAAASSWLLFIFFVPWIGLAVYLVIGRPALPSWRRTRLQKLPAGLAKVIARLRPALEVIRPTLPAGLAAAGHLAQSLGHFRPVGGNAVETLVDYQGALDRLVADIDAATNHVHLLYYIFADDGATAPVIEALRRAAERGVVCRVLVDALGSRAWKKTLLPKLKAAGADVRQALEVGFFRRKAGRMDLRNHRKIAVIDGRVAYTGSQNLVSPTFKPGIEYEELVVRIEGPVALQLQAVFVADWYLESDELLDTPEVFPTPRPAGRVVAQTLPSGPEYERQNTQRLIVALVHGATRRVVLTTPYFIPDEPLTQALQTAVLRGVEVRIVVSEAEDQFLVAQAQKSYYGELLESGVRIHLYRPRFLHAKHLSVDDDVALIGSSNLDIRSFMLNGEISLLFYDPGVAAALRREQERYFAESRELESTVWRGRSRAQRCLQYIIRLMSPLL